MSKRSKAVPTVQVDNERLRVTEWRFAPGAETGWHRHEADYVVVPLADGDLLLEEPGGGSRYGRMVNRDSPTVRIGAAMFANSHSSRRVSRGSIISSTQKLSAVRNGDRSLFSRASISSNFASGSSAASISARYAASIPPSSGSDPQLADGQA